MNESKSDMMTDTILGPADPSCNVVDSIRCQAKNRTFRRGAEQIYGTDRTEFVQGLCTVATL